MNFSIKQYLLISALAIWGIQSVHAADYLVAGYEPSETSLTVTSGEISTIQKVLGGTGDAPFAAEGLYVLKLSWTGQSDRKVECYHGGLNYDLGEYERILIDVYIPNGGALFQSSGLIGIWSSNWLPDNWSGGNIVPTATGQWFTVEMQVSSFNAGNLNHISALVFQDYGADSGTIYIDNIRLANDIPVPVASGQDQRIDIDWEPVSSWNVLGYNVYRSDSATGPFTKIHSGTHPYTFYSDYISSNGLTYYYRIETQFDWGVSALSPVVSASTYAMTDAEFLESVQSVTFRFHWDFGHPVSGLTLDATWAWSDLCTMSGSGFGFANIVVAAEKGFIDRLDAAKRVLKMLTFLDEKTTRYHGAWSHMINGTTGETIPFGEVDDGGDLVETAFLCEGMLIARQYFDGDNPVEQAIRSTATSLWEGVEWDWYRRDPGSDTLWWHWSPNYGWLINHSITGFDETMMAYLLAIASPTHPMPASAYRNGWARADYYRNFDTYYGYRQWVGKGGQPLFFTHYSLLAFDPRNKNDGICNMFDNCRNTTLTHRAYCEANPHGHTDYSNLVWGLTASATPWGYRANSPTIDWEYGGTITPTACASALPYTPVESTAAMRHIYNTYGENLWGHFGFVDAFNPSENWYANGYIAIDQGTIAPMIENHLTGLCWNMFMANPEITNMMDAVGFQRGSKAPMNVPETANGLLYEYYEGGWYSLPDFDTLTPVETGLISNFSLIPRNRDDYFAMRFSGYINILEEDTYYFYLASDDGSRLYIGDKLVVDHDGQHSADPPLWGCIALEAGLHPITVTYFDRTGSHSLTVEYETIDMPRQSIPNNLLLRCNLTGDLTGNCNVNMEDLQQLAEYWLVPYDMENFSDISYNWLVGLE